MTAASTLSAMEARAKQLGLVRTILPFLLLAVILFVLGSCWDQHRAAYADGQDKILDREIAAAQQAAHRATIEKLAERHRGDSLAAAADSTEARANRAERRAQQLASQVRVIDSAHLAVRLTPSGVDSIVGVPPPVVERITSLEQTVALKDSTIAQKDSVIASRDRELAQDSVRFAADSVVIADRTQEVKNEKAARPRFGFKSGVATGITVALLVAHFLK